MRLGWLLLLAGCAAPLREVSLTRELRLDRATFRVHYGPRDIQGEEQTRASLQRIAAHLRPLREPVDIWLVPSHDGLESLVRRGGYDWLRAWARYDEVLLQAPRTWSIEGAADGELDELLLHELSHCAMYQRIATQETFAQRDRQIPLWFREGFASVAARQGVRWGTLEDLARALERLEGEDPILFPEALYRSESRPVYAAAHHAFVFLVRRYGRGAIEALLEHMAGGLTFGAAFERATGLSEPRFRREFRRYVAWRGFRR